MMESSNETHPTGSISAISVLKEQIRRRKLLPIEGKTATHAATELSEADRPPVPSENSSPRTVPAHVHRRADSNTRALPPPSTTTSPRPQRKVDVDKGKGKKRSRLENNSDSESDDDGRDRKQKDQDDTRVSQRKAADNTADTEPRSSFLTAEEQERFRLRGQLRAAEEKWEQFNLDRKERESRRPERERILAADKNRMNLRSDEDEERRMRRIVEIDEAGLQDFYDEFLYSHIEQQLFKDQENAEHMSSRSTAYVDDILGDVAAKVIIRCHNFDGERNFEGTWARNKTRMIKIFDRMQTDLVGELARTCISENDIRMKVLDFLSEKCPLIGHVSVDIEEDVLVKQFLRALSERLIEVAIRDIDFALVAPGVQPISSISTTTSARSARLIYWEEFIDWVKTTFDSNEVMKRCEHRYKVNVRREKINDFRTALSSRIWISQKESH